MKPEELAPFLDLAREPLVRPAAADELWAMVQDEREVHDLVLRYGWLCDARQWDELFELYADDFERVIVGDYEEHFVGKETLRAFYRSVPTTAPVYALRSLVSPPFIRIARNRSTARASVVHDLTRDGDRISRASYLWHLRRDETRGWRFSRLFVVTEFRPRPPPS